MKQEPQLVLYVIGGMVVLFVVWTMRDFIVVGLVSLGAISLYKFVNPPNDKNPPH